MKIIKNEDLDERALRALTEDEKDWVYNALDVTVTFEVHDRQLESIDDTAAKTLAFSMALSGPVFEANLRGTLIDEGERARALSEFQRLRDKVEAQFLRILYEGIGLTPPFNYRSHPQIKFLLYKVLGLKPVLKRNSEGFWTPSADREALEKCAEYHSARLLCLQVLALRELDKRIQFLETEVDNDHRMRTSYNIGGTNTGRLSSSTSDYGTGGNDQNIERILRKVFVPDPGMKFCNIDLEQADARHVGAICWELFVDSHGPEWAGSYLNACESGDLHTTVCRMAWQNLEWGDDPKRWRALADKPWYRTHAYRDGAKKLGHGTNYYGTPRTMSMHTKVPSKLVEDFQIKYFGNFPVLGAVHYNEKGMLVKDRSKTNWHNWVFDQLNQFGFLTTPFYFRRRYFFGRPDDDSTLREAIAYSPQSMTADAIDTAWIRLWEWNRVQVLKQGHDALLMQYPQKDEAEIVPKVIQIATLRHTMKRGREFFVPVEAKVGWNWADADKSNPGGLVKWRGVASDTRTRPLLVPQARFSFAAALDAR